MVHQNWLEKKQATEKEATNEKPKLKVLSIFQLKMIEVRLTLTFNQFQDPESSNNTIRKSHHWSDRR